MLHLLKELSQFPGRLYNSGIIDPEWQEQDEWLDSEDVIVDYEKNPETGELDISRPITEVSPKFTKGKFVGWLRTADRSNEKKYVSKPLMTIISAALCCQIVVLKLWFNQDKKQFEL